MDGRRHSVDIPISKTLVALRRVRSLRDPSTNSLSKSKYSTVIDSMNCWDTSSCHGISLRVENVCDKASLGGNRLVEFKALGTCGEDEEVSNKRPDSQSQPYIMPDSGFIESLVPVASESNVELYTAAAEMKSQIQAEGNCSHHNNAEGRDSNHGSTLGSPAAALGGTNKNIPSSKDKCKSRNIMRSPGSMGDVVSRIGSPHACPPSDSLLDEFEAENLSSRGCGISSCWSGGTPRRRVISTSHFSDEDSYPLLSGELCNTDISEHNSRSWNPNPSNSNSDLVPYSESPRSLSQKFRPKSFNDLVGQNVVSRSLLGAISKGRITCLYIFHGPRGTGKSSAARIFAAALNCLSIPENRPCGVCQECILYFAGRSRDVKEVDSVRINRPSMARSLVKNAMRPPVSSRFKVFIVDECQLLRSETWATLLKSFDFESLSRHAVFVMITPDMDKVPRSAVARSQRYHFPKIKDVDISSRMRKICIREGLEFEQVALDFIAAKSNGSMRDAEMMLDQLSLLSKQITMTLAYELIGTVSDDELLTLLDLALSADTSNTVRRARELMRSRIDPMQLISQLANIIMDILSGKFQEEECSEIKRNFLQKHSSEIDLQKLGNALKILSDSEKQLRTSKNQTTWLTVALLQLNSMDSTTLSDVNEPRLSLTVRAATNSREGECDCCSSSSTTGERSKHHNNNVPCGWAADSLHNIRVQEEGTRTLESVWARAIEKCESNSLKKFLRKRGKVSSICTHKGVAFAQLEFSHPDYASKAERSWKPIASLLQTVLGRNVEIRINHTPTLTPASKARSSFSFFNCSRRMRNRSQSFTESGSSPSDMSNFTCDKPMHNHHHHHGCGHSSQDMAMISTIRSSDGNALSTGTTDSRMGNNTCCKTMSFQGEGGVGVGINQNQKLSLSDSSVCFKTTQNQDNGHANSCSPVRRQASFDTYICTDYPYTICNGLNVDAVSSMQEDVSVAGSKVYCWPTPPFHLKKPWVARSERQQSHSHLVEWVLPCAAAK